MPWKNRNRRSERVWSVIRIIVLAILCVLVLLLVIDLMTDEELYKPRKQVHVENPQQLKVSGKDCIIRHSEGVKWQIKLVEQY